MASSFPGAAPAHRAGVLRQLKQFVTRIGAALMIGLIRAVFAFLRALGPERASDLGGWLLLLAARRLGLKPSECIAIEDTGHGVNSAAAAGVACLAVPNEMSRNHDFSQATAVFEELAAAVSWIERRAAAGPSIGEPFQPHGENS